MYVNATSGGATSNAATANTTTYMHLYDNSTRRHTIQFKGAGGTSVAANNSGVITITGLGIGTSASTAAAGNHTHTLGIATDSGTNELTMAANTKYKITAGGDSFIFTTPKDNGTSYSSRPEAEGGTSTSLCTNGEKYKWNHPICKYGPSAAFSSLPVTFENDAITADMVVLNSVLSNPTAQINNWTVTTAAGSLTISGSIRGSTTITLYLGRCEQEA